MLEIKNAAFKYKKDKGFSMKGVSLELDKGYIYCLLGKNGSGKTTLMKLLFGQLTPDSGEVLWDGSRVNIKNLAAYHKSVAFTGGKWCMENLSVRKNAELLSELYSDFSMDVFEELSERSGMADELDKDYMTLSKGQKVKAELCFNLARRPEYLLLDEPLANLDPVFKTEIVEMLQTAVARDNMTILISTHLLDEISDIVDYIIFMEEGRISRFGDRITMLSGQGVTELRELFD